MIHTIYTDKELRQEAVRLIRSTAKERKQKRPRYIGFDLQVTTGVVRLLAYYRSGRNGSLDRTTMVL